MKYICEGNECEYTKYCMYRLETTSYEESLNGNFTFIRMWNAADYPECVKRAKNELALLKSTRISEIIHRYEIKKCIEDNNFTLKVLKYALKTVGDITEYEMMEQFNSIAEDMENDG